MRQTILLALMLVAAILPLPRCAGRLVTTTQRVLAAADSLLAGGDYLHAKMAYAKVIQNYPNTDWAEEAQYRLGFISLHYNNPFADWESGLAEFTKYQTQYPRGRWADEVNSWLSILHTLQSYNLGYYSRSTETEKLVSKQTFERRKVVGLADSLGRCEMHRDSLHRAVQSLGTRIKELENLILRLQ